MDSKDNDGLSEAVDNTHQEERHDRESPAAEPAQSPDPPTHWSNDFASQLNEFQASTERALSDLTGVVESRLAYDEAKEKAFDRLYAELDELKQGREFEQLRPFFADLVLLFDRLDHLRSESQETDDVSSFVESIREELVEILARRGIDMILPTEQFDPAFQHALGTEQTCDEEKNNHIARVVRRGFRYNSRVIRHEEVFVYRLVPGEPDPDVEDSKRESDAEMVPDGNQETSGTMGE